MNQEIIIVPGRYDPEVCRIAAEARCDPRTVVRFLEGKKMRGEFLRERLEEVTGRKPKKGK